MTFKFIKSLFFIALGIAIMSFGVINFALTSTLGSGGVTGITLILHHLFGVNPGVSTLFINIPLLVIFYFFSDKKTFFLTIYGSLLFSLFLQVFEQIGSVVPDMSGNMTIAAIGFGLTIGIGSGLVMQENGTTGGVFILAKILHDKLHIPMSKTFLIFDSIVIVSSMFFFLGFIDMMYSLLAVYIMTVTIDRVQGGVMVGFKVLIFSNQHEEITKAIQEKLNRGATIVSGVGAYSNQERQIVLVVISKKELNALKEMVNAIDPECFVSVSHTYETLGEGFTFEKGTKKLTT